MMPEEAHLAPAMAIAWPEPKALCTAVHALKASDTNQCATHLLVGSGH